MIGKANNTNQVKKRNLMLNSLPFPPDRYAPYMKKWTNDFGPTMVSWAGTKGNCFAASSHVDLVPTGKNQSPMEESWVAVFPELISCLKDAEKCNVMAALVSVWSYCVRLITNYNECSGVVIFSDSEVTHELA